MQKYPFSFLLSSSVTGTSLSLKLSFYHFAAFRTPQRKQRRLRITWVTGQSSKQVKAQKVHFHGAEENEILPKAPRSGFSFTYTVGSLERQVAGGIAEHEGG